MRAQSLFLLTGGALLAAPVIALPSIDTTHGHHDVLSHSHQQPTSRQSGHQPLWRSLTDSIIRKVWRISCQDTSLVTVDRSQRQKDGSAQRSIRHGGEIVLRFNITSSDELRSLSTAADTLFLDVWEYTDDWVDIRLSKDILPSLLGLLPASLQHAHTPLLQERDLAKAIAGTYPSPRSGRPAPSPESPRYHSFGPELGAKQSEHNLFFADYQPLSVIQPWMRLMSSLFTTHVRLVNIGISYEGRDISALRVGVHPTNDDAPTRRKTILVTGGVHAREWISTSTVNYIAYSLITAYGKDAAVTTLLEDFDWVFIPTFNPDGYVYSWETDRLWRKNRQQTNLRFCRGLDLDRSFGFEWDGQSTHTNPCSESFAGQSAFDGTEAKTLADWARNETENADVDLVGYLDLHSYSQQILYPYSYSCDTAPPSLENLQELAAGLSKSIRQAGGHYYQSAPACEGNVAATASAIKGDRKVFPRFESGGGSALDWFYHELRVKYAYQIKLRDRGTYGFLLPSDHIVPTGREMLDAVMYFGKYLGGQFEVSADVEDAEDAATMTKTEKATEETGEKGVASVSDELLGDETLWSDQDREDDSNGGMWELRRRR